MKVIQNWFLGIALVLVSFVAGISAAWSQLLPPPPALLNTQGDGFTSQDRKVLNYTFRMCRAMHTRLFPLSEEQKLLNGGTIQIEP